MFLVFRCLKVGAEVHKILFMNNISVFFSYFLPYNNNVPELCFLLLESNIGETIYRVNQ